MTEAETIKELKHALEEVYEYIEGYVDIADVDDDNRPIPNNAMRAQMLICQTLKRGYPWE